MATRLEKIHFILQALENTKGDGLERAEAQLKASPTAGDKEWGNSGFTLNQIVERYRQHRRLWEESMRYAKEQL